MWTRLVSIAKTSVKVLIKLVEKTFVAEQGRFSVTLSAAISRYGWPQYFDALATLSHCAKMPPKYCAVLSRATLVKKRNQDASTFLANPTGRP